MPNTQGFTLLYTNPAAHQTRNLQPSSLLMSSCWCTVPINCKKGIKEPGKCYDSILFTPSADKLIRCCVSKVEYDWLLSLVIYIHYCGPDYTFSPHHPPLFISSVENIHKPADIIISIKAGGKQYTNQTQFNHSHLSVTITSLMLK